MEYNLQSIKITKNIKNRVFLKWIGGVVALLLYGVFVSVSAIVLETFLFKAGDSESVSMISSQWSKFGGKYLGNALEAFSRAICP